MRATDGRPTIGHHPREIKPRDIRDEKLTSQGAEEYLAGFAAGAAGEVFLSGTAANLQGYIAGLRSAV